ncbi:MAG: hypothetical protein GY820_39415 [Gammaproteobacteria bacterium]|nr:hypothetical protein [Gammaproteobacteria bacterium]
MRRDVQEPPTLPGMRPGWLRRSGARSGKAEVSRAHPRSRGRSRITNDHHGRVLGPMGSPVQVGCRAARRCHPRGGRQ